MSYFKRVAIEDTSNNPLAVITGSDSGKYLGTASIQHVVEDTNNTSTTNLTSGNSYTFTGTATSTLGVVGLQWALKTDQNATVYIEESNDEENWDVSYSYNYIASKGGRGETVQATMSYWRIRVVLTVSIDTTYFRLAGVLCPIATPLPSSLSPDGRLLSESTLTGQQNPSRHVFVSPLHSLNTQTNVRLIGTSFDGTNKNPSFWTETVANNGTVTQGGGEIVLATSTTANGSATYQSVQRARFVVSRPLKFFGFFALVTDAQADNLRRIGAYDTNDGFFFQVNGTTFSIGTRKATADTLINNGSFNGNYGSTWNPVVDTYYNVAVEYGAYGANFYIDNILLHELGSAHWTRTYTLPVKMENINSNGNETNNLMDCLGAVILGQGEYSTAPIYKHISTATTTICKYGAGVLHNIIVNNPTNAAITVYDNTSAAAPIIAIIDPDNGATPFDLKYNTPFSTGLTIVTAGTPDVTVIYE